jgi:hypothetical protein
MAMANPLSKLLGWLQGGSAKLLAAAGLLLLAWGLLAPVGTLVWWLNQNSETSGVKRQDEDPKTRSNGAADAEINCYIIFLTGVGDYSVDQLTPGEAYFLDRLADLHSNCVTVRDVFPYSAANEDLAGDRLLAPLWKAAENGEGWFGEASMLIKIRNLWRFAISADERYGEIYNQGIASAIINRMDATYPVASLNQQAQIILIGTSGGVQVALGAVSHLDDWLEAKLIVVSAGGTFDGELGFDEADAVYHLRGERDWVEAIPHLLFPSRWRWAVGSPFNRARRAERYVALSSGSHAHDGEEGYFGEAIEPSSQTPYVELTLQQVNQLPFWSKFSPDSASSSL